MADDAGDKEEPSTVKTDTENVPFVVCLPILHSHIAIAQDLLFTTVILSWPSCPFLQFGTTKPD